MLRTVGDARNFRISRYQQEKETHVRSMEFRKPVAPHVVVDERRLVGALFHCGGRFSITYYHHQGRTHDSLDTDTPDRRPVENKALSAVTVISSAQVGGLHHRYSWREAAIVARYSSVETRRQSRFSHVFHTLQRTQRRGRAGKPVRSPRSILLFNFVTFRSSYGYTQRRRQAREAHTTIARIGFCGSRRAVEMCAGE
jgi:hypothetical protein